MPRIYFSPIAATASRLSSGPRVIAGGARALLLVVSVRVGRLRAGSLGFLGLLIVSVCLRCGLIAVRKERRIRRMLEIFRKRGGSLRNFSNF